MKTKFLIQLCFFWLFIAHTYAQQVAFSYDKAGNRTLAVPQAASAAQATRAATPLAITNSAYVGTIDGTADVLPSGAALYSIPIKVPAGTGGVQPNISLIYNSQAGVGVLGVGGSISGISSITRVFSTSQNNALVPVTFTTNSPFELDGNLLIRTGARTFKKEMDDFSQIEALNDAASAFKVTMPNGTIATYGGTGALLTPTAQPGLAFACLLKRYEDRNGNFVNYQYDASGYGLIEEITYSGNYKIKFEYQNNSSPGKGHFAGYFYTKNPRFLKTIKILDDTGKMLFTYQITYTYDNNRLPRLQTIQYLNAESKSLNTTNFQVNESQTSLKGVNYTVKPDHYCTTYGDKYAYKHRAWCTLDNEKNQAKSLVSLFTFHRPDGQYKNILSLYTPTKTSGGGITYTYKTEMEMSPTFQLKDMQGASTLGGTVDFNGDGMQELIIPQFVTDNYLGSDIFFNFVYQNKEGSLAAVNIFQKLPDTQKEMPPFAVEDINGDGISDLLMWTNDGVLKIFYGISNPNWTAGTSFAPATQTIATGIANAKRIFCSDFNNDGLIDIGISQDNSTGMSFFKNTGTLAVEKGVTKCAFTKLTASDTNLSLGGRESNAMLTSGDFNGDGLIDFAYNQDRTWYWYVAYSNGDFTFRHVHIPVETLGTREEDFTSRNDSQDDIVAIDWDNDGLCDLISLDAYYKQVGNNTGQWKGFDIVWLKSTGTNFTRFKALTLTDTEYPYQFLNLVDDFDADGVPEFVRFGENLFNLTAPKSLYAYKMESNPSLKNKVSTIKDGLGKETQFTYASSVDLKIAGYPAATRYTYPVRSKEFPVTVVQVLKQVVPYVGVGTENYFYYHGLVSDAKRRKVLGFENVITLDKLNNTKTTNSCKYLSNGLKEKMSQVAEVNNLPFTSRTTTHTYKNRTLTYGGKSCIQYVPLLSLDVSTDNLTKVTQSTAFTYTADFKNLASRKTTFTGDGFSGYQEEVYETYNAFGQPAKVSVKTKHPDDAAVFTQRTEYKYDVKGNLTEQTDNAHDSAKKVLTRYLNYDAFGNPRQITLSATSGTTQIAKQATYTYTPNGCQVASVTDHTGTTRYTYNKLGKLTETINPYNKTETCTYNSWGELIAEKDIFGNLTSYVTERGYNPDITEVDIKKTITTSGKAPLVLECNIYGDVLVQTSQSNGNTYVTENTYTEKRELVCQVTKCNDILLSQNTYTYDVYGRLIKDVTEKGYTKSYIYSPLNVIVTELVSSDASTLSVKSSKYDFAGNIKSFKNSGLSIDYTYNSNGKPKTITADKSSVNYTYDSCGNEISFKDACLETATVREYDALGNLIKETNPNGKVTTLQYDTYGRLSVQKTGARTTAYTYTARGEIAKITLTEAGNNASKTYTYDAWGRISNETNVSDGMSRAYTYAYDLNNRLQAITYPTQQKVTQAYDAQDGETIVKKQLNGTDLWWQSSKTATETKFTLKSGITELYRYAEGEKHDGMMDITNGILNQSYYFINAPREKPMIRSRSIGNLRDTYVYNNQWLISEKTTTASGTLLHEAQIKYKDSRISNKSDLGSVTYSTAFPQRAVSVTDSTRTLPQRVEIKYNDIDRVSFLSRGIYHATFNYGVSGNCSKMCVYKNNVLEKTFYYDGNYEKIVIAGGDTYENIYEKNVLAPDVLLQTRNGVKQTFYLHKDLMGSIIAITNSAGAKVETRGFDAWGRQRNPNATSPANYYSYQPPANNKLITNHAFTGEENLNEFGLVNLNARLYDPYLCCFISPDAFLHPNSIVGFNRYAYAFNNPLMYTDKDGETPFLIFAIAAAYGAGTNLISNADNIHSFWDGVGYFAAGAAGGAVSVVNPALGGGITAAGNVAIDAINGRLPSFKDFGQTAAYAVSKGMDVWGISSAGKVGVQVGGKLLNGNFIKATVEGSFAPIDKSIANGIAGLEIGVVALAPKNTVGISSSIQTVLNASKLSRSDLISKIGIKSNKAVPINTAKHGKNAHHIAGTEKHKYAKDLFDRYKRRYGGFGMNAEKYFNRNDIPGRPDLIDVKNNVIYDYKFGKAGMSRKQIKKYVDMFGPDVQINVVRGDGSITRVF